MSNRSPNQPENITSSGRPSNRLRPLGQAPSAVIKTISNIAKATTLYLAALAATPDISQAQEPVPGPNHSQQMTLGIEGESNNATAAASYHIKGSFVVPSIDFGDSTGYPYNSIFGLNSHAMVRTNPNGWGIGPYISQYMRYLQLTEVDQHSLYEDFYQYNSAFINLHYKKLYLGVGFHIQDLLRFDPNADEFFDDYAFILGLDSDIFGFQIQYATALANSDTPDYLAASVDFHINPDLSIGLNYRYADSLLAAFVNQEQQAYAHSFGGMLTYRIGSHTQPVSSRVGIGGRYEDQALGTGLDISHVFSINHDAQKPTNLPVSTTGDGNTDVKASVDTACQESAALDFSSSSVNKDQLEKMLTCKDVVTVTLKANQIKEVIDSAQTKVNKISFQIKNPDKLKGQGLVNLLKKITNAHSISFLDFTLDPYAKYLIHQLNGATHAVLKGAQGVEYTEGTEETLAHNFPDIFNPTAKPHFDGTHYKLPSNCSVEPTNTLIVSGSIFYVEKVSNDLIIKRSCSQGEPQVRNSNPISFYQDITPSGNEISTIDFFLPFIEKFDAQLRFDHHDQKVTVPGWQIQVKGSPKAMKSMKAYLSSFLTENKQAFKSTIPRQISPKWSFTTDSATLVLTEDLDKQHKPDRGVEVQINFTKQAH